MRLTYTHWKHGELTVEVSPTSRPGYYATRARLILVGPMIGDVFNAGDILSGEIRPKTPVRVGWNGRVTE